jgi:hypothetical protein
MSVENARTCEILTRRISLTRVESVGQDPKGVVVGWEYSPPRKGERYAVYLGKGRVLRTSVVEDVRENMGSLLIKTANSIYKVQYLNGK